MAKKRVRVGTSPVKKSVAKTKRAVIPRKRSEPSLQTSFAEVVELIQRSRQQALQSVNTVLVDLYWRVGEYISRKLETATWGEGVVEQLRARQGLGAGNHRDDERRYGVVRAVQRQRRLSPLADGHDLRRDLPRRRRGVIGPEGRRRRHAGRGRLGDTRQRGCYNPTTPKSAATPATSLLCI